MAEARKALEVEAQRNINRFAAETKSFRLYVPILQTDLAVFQYFKQHPGAPSAQWPGTINWSWLSFIFLDAAWKAAQQSGVLEHMRDSDVRHYALLYRRIEVLNELGLARRDAIYRASMYTIAQPDASLLSPMQIEEQITLTMSALQAYVRCADSQWSMSEQLPEFASPPTQAEVSFVAHRAGDAAIDRAGQALSDKVLNFEKGLTNSQ